MEEHAQCKTAATGDKIITLIHQVLRPGGAAAAVRRMRGGVRREPPRRGRVARLPVGRPVVRRPGGRGGQDDAVEAALPLLPGRHEEEAARRDERDAISAAGDCAAFKSMSSTRTWLYVYRLAHGFIRSPPRPTRTQSHARTSRASRPRPSCRAADDPCCRCPRAASISSSRRALSRALRHAAAAVGTGADLVLHPRASGGRRRRPRATTPSNPTGRWSARPRGTTTRYGTRTSTSSAPSPSARRACRGVARRA